MPELSARDQKLLEVLYCHPHLRERIESLLCIAEDAEMPTLQGGITANTYLLFDSLIAR